MKAIVLSLLIFLAFPLPLRAYNFLYIHPTKGTPIKWDNTKPIRYWLDPGKLGRLTNDQAHTLLKEAMKIWENASPNAKVPHFEFAGLLPEDVNGTNYKKYVSPYECYTKNLSACDTDTQKNLQTVIVFDQDRSIIEGVCGIFSGACAKANVFSETNIDPLNIVNGLVLLSGDDLFISGSGRSIVSSVGLMVHELGHLLGLAHTSVNEEAYISGLYGWDQYMPTMFFISVPASIETTDRTSVSLNPDDIAGISTLYPSERLSSVTGTVKGTVSKSDGSPMMHVNVIARNVNDPVCEAYSFLTGRFCPRPVINVKSGGPCQTEVREPYFDGSFDILSLPPGSYTVEVEEVVGFLASTFSPGLVDKVIEGDAEFWNEGDVADEPNNKLTVITVKGGEKKENVNIVLSRSKATPDRIKYFPLSTFTPGPGTACPEEPTVDYAKLIGIDEPKKTAGPLESPKPGMVDNLGGCSLMPLSF